MDRLDIDVTYGETGHDGRDSRRHLLRGINFDGRLNRSAQPGGFAKKTSHYQKDMKRIGKELQIIAFFDSAGWPSPADASVSSGAVYQGCDARVGRQLNLVQIFIIIWIDWVLTKNHVL